MGSVGEFEKGQTPFLDRVKAHNDRYHRAMYACYDDAPFRLKLLAKLGIKQPLYDWQAANQHKYWP
jgi:hypothetical protein